MSSAHATAETLAALLTEDTAYGKLPFDCFVLEHWDYTRPTQEDQQQWNKLAKRWLSMKPRSREPYEEAAFNLRLIPEDDSRMPTQDQVNRVLVPYQTIQERNLANPRGDCVWLRTCYEPTLALQYKELTEVYLNTTGSTGKERILENERLYGNLGEGLGELFLRVPQLPIFKGGLESEDFEEDQPEGESSIPLYTAAVNERLLIYVLDAEALREKMIKLNWFSLKGELLWWNWLQPSEMQDWEGHVNGLGHRLRWIYELSDSDTRLLQNGSHVILN